MLLVPQKSRRPLLLVVAGIAVAILGYAMIRPTPLVPPARAQGSGTPSVAQAQTAFGIDLLGRLTQATPGHNIVFSPASIATILTLTMSGAGTQTRADMARALHLSALPAQEVDAGIKELVQNDAAKSGVTLSVANALWADNGVSFAPAFQAQARDVFAADAQTLDFSLFLRQRTRSTPGWAKIHGAISPGLCPRTR